jgi:hypothetical protein
LERAVKSEDFLRFKRLDSDGDDQQRSGKIGSPGGVY